MVSGPGFDETLVKAFGDQLRRFVEKSGSRAFQLRDNEFAVVIPAPHSPREVVLTDTLLPLKQVLENLVVDGELEVPLHISMGVAELRAGDHSTALSRADQALRTAETNHLPISFYNQNDRSLKNVQDELACFGRLRSSLQKEALVVVFQPVCDAKTLEPVFYEALLRVRGRDGALESIFPLLSIAESTGLMPRLALFVLRQASNFVRTKGLPVSINLSTQDIQDSQVNNELKLQLSTLAPGSIILEFLERGDLHSLAGFPEFLATMRQAGCLLALDDFGSGYSNFSTLVEFPLNIVKLDGALVRKSESDAKALLLIETLTDFSRKVGLTVVAEHIESAAMVERFRKIGVDLLQGYHLGKPQPA